MEHTLIAFLIALLIIALIIWVINFLGLPDPIKKIAIVIVVIIAVIYFLRLFGLWV